MIIDIVKESKKIANRYLKLLILVVVVAILIIYSYSIGTDIASEDIIYISILLPITIITIAVLYIKTAYNNKQSLLNFETNNEIEKINDEINSNNTEILTVQNINEKIYLTDNYIVDLVNGIKIIRYKDIERIYIKKIIVASYITLVMKEGKEILIAGTTYKKKKNKIKQKIAFDKIENRINNN